MVFGNSIYPPANESSQDSNPMGDNRHFTLPMGKLKSQACLPTSLWVKYHSAHRGRLPLK
jgi:hypothetical protein